MNKTSSFVQRFISTDVDGLNSWSRWKIIDTGNLTVELYCS